MQSNMPDYPSATMQEPLKKQQRGILAIVLVVIIFVSILGTITFLSISDQVKNKRFAAQVVKAPSVSLTILPAEEPEEADLYVGSER